MTKLRFYLPTVQTALAVLLMFLNWRRAPLFTGLSLDSQISYAINCPAALISLTVARVWTMSTAAWVVVIYPFYFALVALLWYAVAVEVRGTHGSLLMTKLVRQKGFRQTADAVLVGLGLLLMLLGFLNLVFSHRWQREIAMEIGASLWGLAIASYYARDFYICNRPQHRQPD